MAGRFSIEAVFKAVDKITAPVTRMQNRVGKFTRRMERGFRKVNRVVDKFTAGIKRAAVVTTAALVASGAAFANVLGAGADFEQAITNVGAVTLQTRKQIEPLEKLALQLGKTTQFTATQSANAMEIMARAGFSTNEILKATPAVLAAAAASGLEIAEVADVVSNALKGMGLDAGEAGRVADVLTLASARTNSSIGSLGESLKNVASTARQLGIPLEETVASVAMLQDVGLDASVAGSAMNVMLTKMAAPSAGMIKKMRKLGITFKDAKGNMLPLQKVIEQLNKASDKVGGNFDKVAFLAELVGLRGQKAAANLGDLFAKGKLAPLIKELEQAEGAAKKMADIRMNTVQGSMLLLGSAIDAVKVKIFNMNDGPLKKLIDRMTEWVSTNEDLIASKIANFLGNLISNIDSIVETIKDLGKTFGVFIAFITLIKMASIAFSILNFIMFANPLGLTIKGVLLLIGAFTALVVWIDEISAGFDKLPAIIQLVLAPFGLLVKVIKFIKDNIGVVGTIVGKIGSILGFSDDDEAKAKLDAADKRAAQVISPQERVARSIEERTNTNTAEVTIKDDTGRAEVSKGKLGPGLTLQSSGAF